MGNSMKEIIENRIKMLELDIQIVEKDILSNNRMIKIYKEEIEYSVEHKLDRIDSINLAIKQREEYHVSLKKWLQKYKKQIKEYKKQIDNMFYKTN